MRSPWCGLVRRAGPRGGVARCGLPLGVNACSVPKALAALEDMGIEWENALDTESDRTVEVTIAADMAVGAMIEGTEPRHLEVIEHGGHLPELGKQRINMYGADPSKGELICHLADLLRRGFRTLNTYNDTSEAAPRIALV